jgi:ketosteroid isomerase-like protein
VAGRSRDDHHPLRLFQTTGDIAMPRGRLVEEPAMDAQVEDEILSTAHEWDRAMVTNDPDEIGAYMADEWTIVGPDGSIGDKAAFLGWVRSGELTHDTMESHDMTVRVYGDTAVVTGRGVSSGHYRGKPFHLVERVSCVFVREQHLWKCVLTHLSLISGP